MYVNITELKKDLSAERSEIIKKPRRTRKSPEEIKKRKNAYQSAWQKRNRDKINTKNRLKYNTDKRWKKHIKKKFGLSPEAYDALLTKQGNKCAVCDGQPIVKTSKHACKGRYAIDHNHETGMVRGLLCQRCNLGLGAFSDKIYIVRKALEYLIKHDTPLTDKS